MYIFIKKYEKPRVFYGRKVKRLLFFKSLNICLEYLTVRAFSNNWMEAHRCPVSCQRVLLQGQAFSPFFFKLSKILFLLRGNGEIAWRKYLLMFEKCFFCINPVQSKMYVVQWLLRTGIPKIQSIQKVLAWEFYCEFFSHLIYFVFCM